VPDVGPSINTYTHSCRLTEGVDHSGHHIFHSLVCSLRYLFTIENVTLRCFHCLYPLMQFCRISDEEGDASVEEKVDLCIRCSVFFLLPRFRIRMH